MFSHALRTESSNSTRLNSCEVLGLGRILDREGHTSGYPMASLRPFLRLCDNRSWTRSLVCGVRLVGSLSSWPLIVSIGVSLVRWKVGE